MPPSSRDEYHLGEVMSVRVDDPYLDLEKAIEVSNAKAKEICAAPILLSWKNSKSGIASPEFDLLDVEEKSPPPELQVVNYLIYNDKNPHGNAQYFATIYYYINRKNVGNSKLANTEKPAWVKFAEARGGDLTIQINDGEFIFIYLK